jgi:hypothetical protein
LPALLENKDLSKRQRDELQRSLNAYGKLGDNNGLKVAFGNLSGEVKGKTGFTIATVKGKETVLWLKDNGDGNYVPNVTVTFDGDYDEDSIAHEGSHSADRQDLVNSIIGRINNGENVTNEMILADPKNIRKYDTELRAYLVSSAANKGMAIETKVWQKGWGEADSKTLNAINNLLKSEYKLSPHGTKPGPGPQLLEFSEKR